MSEVAERLRRARARIENPQYWTQEAFARVKSGAGCLPYDPDANCWCAIGAIRADRSVRMPQSEDFLDIAAKQIFNTNPVRVNDDIGHAAVMRMFDRAIELAEAQS